MHRFPVEKPFSSGIERQRIFGREAMIAMDSDSFIERLGRFVSYVLVTLGIVMVTAGAANEVREAIGLIGAGLVVMTAGFVLAVALVRLQKYLVPE